MARKSRQIRVGIIRCDAHALYYGVLMDDFDPQLLKDPGLPKSMYWGGKTIHFVIYRNCYLPAKMAITPVKGFSIAKVWDKEIEVARAFSRTFRSRPKVCRSIQEVSDGVDLVFIANCSDPGYGADHRKLATPGLSKGVPTFIDKPFTHDVADAVELIQLADKRKAPLMSLSMLREQPEGIQFRRRLAELQPLKFGSVIGPGGNFAGIIHGLSLAQNIFGGGVVSVECMGQAELEHILLRFDGQKDKPYNGVMVHSLPRAPDPSGAWWTWKTGLYATACSPERCIVSHGIGDFEYPYGAIRILEKIKKMVRTGKTQASHHEMLELIAIATAARRSQKEKRVVRLAEVSRVFK